MKSQLCDDCFHFRRPLKCEAFPNSIPYKILNGDDPHKKVRPDQVGTYTRESGEEYTKRVTREAEKFLASEKEISDYCRKYPNEWDSIFMS